MACFKHLLHHLFCILLTDSGVEEVVRLISNVHWTHGLTKAVASTFLGKPHPLK